LAESIGKRIKTLRTGQGKTLAELGEKANLSTSYLSQIERDKTSPSLTTLETIAKSLNIGLRYFFETDDEATLVVRANNGINTPTHRDPVVRQPLMPQMGNPKIEVYRITYHPHFAPEQIEQFAGEEIIYVLDGELTISIGEEQFVLTAGDSIHYDALLIHSWKNESNDSCTIIWGRALSLSDYQPSSVTRLWNKIPEENGI
jgi:quercetin dioxygenase-like cupin family protein/DNA-binding XRE family transcriptional regulator